MKNLIPHESYFANDFFEREKKLLDQCWFFAGLKNQLQNEQDFITSQHFGVPVFITKAADGLKGFVNRCLHRGCPIFKLGSSGNKSIKCQYHGWLYESNGQIKAIPFSQSFPETPTNSLEEINVESCGELIFYSFIKNQKSLKDYLGSFYSELEEISGPP